MNRNPAVLLVDDSENDRLLTRIALKEAGFQCRLQEACNGEEAIAYLKGDGPYSERTKYPLPEIMLLDLNMPMKNGFDVLMWVRALPAFKHMPIVVLTASMRTEDIARAYELGASSFLVKPSSIGELTEMSRCLRDWFQYNHFPPRNETVGT